MKILIPYDIDTTGNRNPYLFLLLRALSAHKDVERVDHGFGFLHEPTGHWDIIHLHWPEQLVRPFLETYWSDATVTDTHIKKVTDALSRHKASGSKILMTIHNEAPHKDPSGGGKRLYEEVWRQADGFHHLGEASRAQLTSTLPDRPSVVIPHGDYRWFPDEQSREEARKALDMSPETTLILAFGAIRNQAELNLGLKAHRQAKQPGSLYLMAGSVPYPYRVKRQHWNTRRLLFREQWAGRARTVERSIRAGEVQSFLNAADLLFLPRIDALNSGNVPLGFTFGRVVVGPNIGVIGEMLRETGNPTFDPRQPESAAGAIREGLRLARNGHGETNRAWSREHLNWEVIADRTVHAFHALHRDERMF
ncbi:MAG: hypothetical protein WEA36_00850 [Balneolaceae bacterium]